MSQSQRRFWMVVVFLYVMACLWLMSQYELALDADNMTSAARATMKSNILLSFVVITVGTLRLHPRFGMLHPSLRSMADFSVFLALLLGWPIVMVLSTPTMPKTSRDILIALCQFVCVAVYALNRFIFPEIVRRKNYTLAHRILDTMQRFMLQNANLYVTHGLLYISELKFEEAIDAASHAIALIPRAKNQGEFQVYDWRLISAHDIRMRGYFALGQHDLALEDTEIQVRLYPDEPGRYLNRSIALLQLGDFVAAEADLDRAAKFPLIPFLEMYLTYSRGYLAARQGHVQVALELYQKALDVPLPDDQKKAIHPETYAQIGILDMQQGDDAAAERAFQQMKALNPDYIHVGVVGLHAKREEWDAAIAEWQKLTARTPRLKQRDTLQHMFSNYPALLHLIEQTIDRMDSSAA